MKSTLKTWVKYIPLLVLLYPLHKACSIVAFEYKLKSFFIAFEDFPADYAEALRHEKSTEYSWPPLSFTDPAQQLTIPPIIHFIWFKNLYHDHLDVSRIPEALSHAPGQCLHHNPNFNIRIWNATEARGLLEEHYSWFLDVYDNYKHPIQRVDAFKYFVLWHFGGIYMDLDVACRRGLEPLLNFSAWYPKASLFGVNNDLIASRARHPLTGLMLRELTERDKNWLFPYLTIYWSTGPQFTSDVLEKYSSHLRSSNAESVRVLPKQFYSEEYTFFGHSPGGTWHGKDVSVVIWCVKHSWMLLIIPFILGVMAMRDPRVKRAIRATSARVVPVWRTWY